ncbi:transcriptional regulator [Halolactibacillus alkaliphilus]|uniref:Transcriptional regulator n=1 Tax=Halolactibacillus alkaliphilus TaxID=442899 RepID=A0A511X4F8_9BACI|nr:LCP family protein [Halolactibacillus alkaliphilus]GEN57828.1 transcriptional regulator [Halolactibacillus alkaliphilus]GGN75280.1 transcriptional regulator [Halolactibacillus alkaliphilus]SFP06105.1 transcriptional attenuator, LytR family [Halolactibacillus alkaliphilus]
MDNENTVLRTQYKKDMKKTKRKKRLKFFVIFSLVIIASGIGYGWHMVNQAMSTVDNSYVDDGREDGSELRTDKISTDKDNISILFIGVDRGGGRSIENTNGLSDTLILATFNREEHSVKMVTIPRDSYVYLPLRDTYTKINHAHSYDGTKGAILTVEHLFEIPVDYYVKVNFDAFIDVVDALGGIDVEVPYEMYEMDSNDTKNAIHLLPGEQRLDGEEALALARTRRYDNDIERGKRQQEIIKAMFDRALSVNAILNYNRLLTAVGDNMATDINSKDMTNLSTYLLDKDFRIETLTLEGSDMITDLYYYKLDEEHLLSVKAELKMHLEIK